MEQELLKKIDNFYGTKESFINGFGYDPIRGVVLVFTLPWVERFAYHGALMTLEFGCDIEIYPSEGRDYELTKSFFEMGCLPRDLDTDELRSRPGYLHNM